jgi:hypothetical protein
MRARVWVGAVGPACDGEVQLVLRPIYVDGDAKPLHSLHQGAILDVQAGHQALARREQLVEVEVFRHVATHSVDHFSTVSTEGVSRLNKAAAHGGDAPRSATFLLLQIESRVGV